MLKKETTALVLIDVQGKLAEIVAESEQVIDHITKAVQCANVLELPILWLEQYPKGLGPTTPAIAEHMNGTPIEKITFSAYDTPQFVEALEATGCKNVLLTGIEAHICVYQTAAHLLANGYQVEVLADCVSSRTVRNRDIGIQKMLQIGANITSVEMAFFEMLQIAKGDQFKAISKIVK